MVREIKERTGVDNIEELHIATATGEVLVKGSNGYFRVYPSPWIFEDENRRRVLVEPLGKLG